MSKAKKHVEWCIRKAKKELEKDGKHRGLVKIEPDERLAQEHIQKAEHNLEVFILNRDNNFYDWAINMGFYVMYHCCLAIIAKFGYETRNQECTLALIESSIEDGTLNNDFRR